MKEKIFGHTDAISHLEKLLQAKTIPHALLFSGPASVGKHTTARAFACRLLAGADDPSALKLIEVGNHPDLHFVEREEEKKDLSVEQIRSVIDALSLKPYCGKASVVIINNAEEMSLGAANALLKTLEEPAANNFLILVSSAPQRLPTTIISRCQLIHFGELKKIDIERIVQKLFGSEVSPDTVKGISALCASSLEALGLDDFIEPRTFQIGNKKKALAHIEDLVNESVNLRREFERFSDSQPSEQEIAIFAHNFSRLLDKSDLPWRIMRDTFRGKMKTDLAKTSSWSALLSRSIEAEALVKERNANAQLQITSLLLRL